MLKNIIIASILLISVTINGFAGDVYSVKATAYTSTKRQTDSTPCIGAWGDNICRLNSKGVKIIAVSRDLERFGFKHNKKVMIKFKGSTSWRGPYVIKDRMNKRWERRIDIYMGHHSKATAHRTAVHGIKHAKIKILK